MSFGVQGHRIKRIFGRSPEDTLHFGVFTSHKLVGCMDTVFVSALIRVPE
jgi:hypothetical protein